MTDPQEMNQLDNKRREAVESFVRLIQKYQQRSEQQQTRYSTLLNDLVREIGYESYLERIYKEPEERSARWSNVEEVINALASWQERQESEGGNTHLEQFLEDIALGDREFDDEKEKQLKRNAVVLLTLHSAKGLEFPYVYMVGMEEGILPHSRSLADDEKDVDEERRLCYVGITRAQEKLTFSLPLTRFKWGKAHPTKPSRFLYELSGKAENPLLLRKSRPAKR